MELRDYLRILRKYWIMILLIALATISVTAAVTFTQTSRYESETQLYVSVRTDGAVTGDLVQGTNFARQVVTSYVDVVNSDLVLASVIDELGLETTSQELAEQVSASSPSDTVLINITVTDTDPQHAAQIADATAESFINVVEGYLEKPDGDDPSPVKLQTIQPALVSAAQVSPNIERNFALGVILGAMLGFGAAVLRTVLDTRIHSADDVSEITEKPVLGAIIADPDAAKRPLTVHVDPHHPRAESFRSLRTNLQFLDVEGGARTYVVSSSGPGEGKSTTAVNIALSFAETSVRVALIDGDLRRPKVAEYMGLEGGVGLSDVLIGRAEVGDVMQRWGNGSLYVLSSGRIPPNPSELLGSKAMHNLLKLLNEQFDYVIIDSPPLLLVTDAAVVSKTGRGVILVAASGQTRKGSLDRSIQTLEAAKSELLGVVMTRVPTKGPDSYYSAQYYSYTHHGSLSGANNALPRRGRHGKARSAKAK